MWSQRSLFFLAGIAYGLLSFTGRTKAQDIGALRDALQATGVKTFFDGDAAYVDASVAFNLRYNVSPIAITYPTSAEQVGAVVAAGAGQHYAVTARSGGHSYVAGGLGGEDGSLVVDLSNFKDIVVDEVTNTVQVGAGNRLGDVALRLNDYGRALPHGRCTTVGVGGHATGGGFGFQSRMWGLLLDRVVSETVVLGNGSVVTASKDENVVLFWGLRGAGASLGIVVSFVFATEHAPPQATAFWYNWDFTAAEAARAISSFQDFVRTDIPPTLGGELVLNKSSASGNVAVQYFGVYLDDSATFDKTVAPYLDLFPKPDSKNITQGDWITVFAAWASGSLNTSTMPPQHNTFYVKSIMTPDEEGISDTAINALTEYLATTGFDTDLSWFIEVETYGGSNSAINAVPVNDTAFAHRNKLFNLQLYAYSQNELPPYPNDGFAFVDGMADSILQNEAKDWPWGSYVNYPDDRLENWQKLYYGQHYERLTQLKSLYDPGNVFQFPHAVEEKA
ncbi:hypothetical protein EV121DRAFT_288963 [Schizophyllum commune]